MTIKKLDDGRYEVDIRPAGRNGKRIRRKFDKKSEAVAFEKHTQFNHHTKEWLSKPTDKRHLSELIQLWWNLKGKHEEHGRINRSWRYALPPPAPSSSRSRLFLSISMVSKPLTIGSVIRAATAFWYRSANDSPPSRAGKISLAALAAMSF